MAKGTNKTIKSLLNKALEVLINRQEKLGNEVDKIREMLKINEYEIEQGKLKNKIRDKIINK